MADVHITPEGLEAVEKELDELTSQKRPSIVAKIKAARELGDLSENFEYHAAKNEQGFMEARINELEQIIKNHVLIEKPGRSELVAMGSTVRFREDGEDEEMYRIVGPAEADPKAGRVSYESALGTAPIARRVGGEAEVRTPSASYRVRLLGLDRQPGERGRPAHPSSRLAGGGVDRGRVRDPARLDRLSHGLSRGAHRTFDGAGCARQRRDAHRPGDRARGGRAQRPRCRSGLVA